MKPTRDDQMVRSLRGRSLLKPDDLTCPEFLYLIQLARELRVRKRDHDEAKNLSGRNFALIFEKVSTRTRSAFEVGAHDQGAHVTYFGPNDSHLGFGESAKDSARVLGRMFDGIEHRGFHHDVVETLERYAGVPVWNGLSDSWHPTQMLADVLTITDHLATPLNDLTLCYLGDARNNTAQSLLITGALLGMDVRLIGPSSLVPEESVRQRAFRLAAISGSEITISDDVAQVRGADILYTDVWVSMGELTAKWQERITQLMPYQINRALLNATNNPDVKVLHCLPALHDVNTELGRQMYAAYGVSALEVTDDVFESPSSLVFDQAENRLHTIKALMVATVPGPCVSP
jgi:ornithine carbamoyltransferase